MHISRLLLDEQILFVRFINSCQFQCRTFLFTILNAVAQHSQLLKISCSSTVIALITISPSKRSLYRSHVIVHRIPPHDIHLLTGGIHPDHLVIHLPVEQIRHNQVIVTVIFLTCRQEFPVVTFGLFRLPQPKKNDSIMGIHCFFLLCTQPLHRSFTAGLFGHHLFQRSQCPESLLITPVRLLEYQ